jgi:phosphohistidine phosphatase SixA
VAASGCGSEDSDSAPQPAGGVPARLVERLREGGYVVAFRHAATDSGIDTTNDLSDCSKQRNLNAEGRRQSRGIGQAFDRMEIPVDEVLASPFCRTRDTARLAFGRVEPSRALLSVEFFASPREGRRKGLRRMLATEPRRGTNTVLVSHGSAIVDATEVDPEEGDAVIVQPQRRGRGFAVVSTVTADEWRRTPE